jgi:hypothetical protein
MRTFVGYENAHKYALKNIFTICTYNSPSTWKLLHRYIEKQSRYRNAESKEGVFE